LLNTMKIGLWKIGRGSCGQMRPKSTGLGQMGGCILGKRRENHFLTGKPHPPSSMEEEIISWYGGVGWNGVGKLTVVQGIMDASNTVRFWTMQWWKVLKSVTSHNTLLEHADKS